MAIRFGQSIDLDGNKVLNVPSPSMASEVASKGYVDALVSGLVWKETVRAAATTNVTLSNPGVIDGVTLAEGNRVLLMGQTDTTTDGLYTLTGGTLVRSTDADENGELRPGTAVSVSEGTSQGNHTYVLISDSSVTVGVTPQNWALMNAGTVPDYTQGNGIDITNHRVTVVGATNGGLAVSASGVAVVADPSGGLTVGATGVKLSPATGKGLTSDATGAQVVVSATGALAVDTNGVAVKLATPSALSTGASGLAVVADPAGGLTVAATGAQVKSGNKGISVDTSGVSVVADTARALSVTNAGVGVVVKPNTGLFADITGISVVPDTSTGLSVGAAGISQAVDASKAMLTSAAGPGVKAGAGILVDSNGVAIDTTKVVRKFTAATVGDGTATTITLTHNLGTKFVGVELFEASGVGATVRPEVQRPDANTVQLLFGHAPTAGQYSAVVWG